MPNKDQALEVGARVATWFNDAEAVSIVTVIILGAAILFMLRFAVSRWEPRERPPRRSRGNDNE